MTNSFERGFNEGYKRASTLDALKVRIDVFNLVKPAESDFANWLINKIYSGEKHWQGIPSAITDIKINNRVTLHRHLQPVNGSNAEAWEISDLEHLYRQLSSLPTTRIK